MSLQKEDMRPRRAMLPVAMPTPFQMRAIGFGECFFLLLLMILSLLVEVFKLRAENGALHNKIHQLEHDCQKYYEQAHLGSDTSGISPNKDWKKCNAPRDTAETPGFAGDQEHNEGRETPISVTGYIKKQGGKKQPGGQKNHPPSFLKINGAQEREPVFHYPGKCVHCPNIERCKEEGRLRKFATSHGYDTEIIIVHRVHLQYEASNCLNDGKQFRENFPQIIGARYYEENIQLHVITWHHIFHGSYDRIDLVAKDLFGISLSAGTAHNIIQRDSAKILAGGFMDAIRFYVLLFEKVAGADETSANVAGITAWVHTVATDNVTLLSPHWRRGYEGAIHAGVLQFFTGTLISDCWSAYFKEIFVCRHSICDGHILRELVAAAYFRSQSWAIRMFDFLMETLTDKEETVGRGENALPQTYLDKARENYRQIVSDGFNEIAGVTSGKTYSLLNRLKKLEDAALEFAVDFNVGFTNNVSERSLRNLKVALRVAGQFKTMQGLWDYCIFQSFIDTCRKLGHNPLYMLRIALAGGNIIEAAFDDDKAVILKLMVKLANAYSMDDANEINTI
jgi:transposase